MAKSLIKKYSSKKISIFIILLLVVAVMLTLGFSLNFWRRHQTPDDIRSFVFSSYSGSESLETQHSQMLTLTPTSCTYVVMSPGDGNFAPTTSCPMNAAIWKAITTAYFTNSVPTQSLNQSSEPVTGPLILLGVYYKDGTSNTVYFTNPIPTNLADFLQVLKSNESVANQL